MTVFTRFSMKSKYVCHKLISHPVKFQKQSHYANKSLAGKNLQVRGGSFFPFVYHEIIFPTFSSFLFLQCLQVLSVIPVHQLPPLFAPVSLVYLELGLTPLLDHLLGLLLGLAQVSVRVLKLI